VRATGGLDDTIDSSTGFKFEEYTGAAMLAALREALAAFRDRKRWKKIMQTGMSRDFSWAAAARQYSVLYDSLLNPKAG
jgi:starch synthase